MYADRVSFRRLLTSQLEYVITSRFIRYILPRAQNNTNTLQLKYRFETIFNISCVVLLRQLFQDDPLYRAIGEQSIVDSRAQLSSLYHALRVASNRLKDSLLDVHIEYISPLLDLENSILSLNPLSQVEHVFLHIYAHLNNLAHLIESIEAAHNVSRFQL